MKDTKPFMYNVQPAILEKLNKMERLTGISKQSIIRDLIIREALRMKKEKVIGG